MKVKIHSIWRKCLEAAEKFGYFQTFKVSDIIFFKIMIMLQSLSISKDKHKLCTPSDGALMNTPPSCWYLPARYLHVFTCTSTWKWIRLVWGLRKDSRPHICVASGGQVVEPKMWFNKGDPHQIPLPTHFDSHLIFIRRRTRVWKPLTYSKIP